MNWLIEVIKSIMGVKSEDRKATAEERKARAEEEKARFYAMQVLNQEYRIIIDQQEKYIAELKGKLEKGEYRKDLEVSFEREIECHRQLIECAIKEKELKEQIVFLKIDIALLEKKVRNSGNGKH